MDIGVKIKELRNKKNISVDEFSKELEMSRQQIYNWEQGKSNPPTNVLDKIANYFNVDVKYFFTESNNIGQNLNPDLIFILKDQIETLKKEVEYLKSQNERLLVKY